MRSAALLLALFVSASVVRSAEPGPDVILEERRRGDVIPMGMKWAGVSVKVDAGPFASCVCTRYPIVKGDTLEAIARRECGSVRCVAEILLLNPKVKPTALQPGDSLVLPPRPTPGESRPTTRAGGAQAGWILFQIAYRFGRRMGPAPLVDGHELESFRGGANVIAVPREKLAWFLGLNFDKGFEKPPEGLVFSEPIWSSEYVPEKEATVRMERTVTLKAPKDGVIPFDLNEKRYDAGGRLVSESTTPAGSKPKSGAIGWPLLAIAGAALLGAVGMARRRRSSCVEAPPPVP